MTGLHSSNGPNSPNRKSLSPIRYICAILAMGRPYFLVGSAALYALGVAAVWREGYDLTASTLSMGLLLVWLVQLATHYNNEYWDLETDRATLTPTLVSGGSRVLVKGIVPRKTARAAAICALLLAMALAIFLMTLAGAGWQALAFIAPGLFVGWFYSNPPFKLVSRGLGEIAVVIVSAFLTPGLAFYLQGSAFDAGLFIVCTPLALLAFSVTLATATPDIAADAATGKRTLAVRLGRRRAVAAQTAGLVAGWLSFVAVALLRMPALGWLAVALSLPFVAASLFYARRSSAGDATAMERTGLGQTLVLGYATLALIAALVAG